MGRLLTGEFARTFSPFISRQRAENGVEVTVAEHFRRRVRVAIGGDILDELVHNLEADFLMRLLTAAKAELDPHLHVIAQKLDGVIALGRQVVRVNDRRDLDLLHLARGGPGVRFSLRFLVQEFAVVHDPADGRGRVGHYLDEIQVLALGQAQSVVERHDPELLFVVVDHPDFSRTDLSVATMQRFARSK